MIDSTAEFHSLNILLSEALGEPGQRTFRVVAHSDDGKVILWLEKEQLLQLAIAVNQLLSSLSDQDTNSTMPEAQAPSQSGNFEFKVGKLVLHYDDGRDRIVIDAHDLGAQEENPPVVRLWSDKSQASTFADEALRQCAAGRPICALCGKSVDSGGHQCPRSNGHGLHELGNP